VATLLDILLPETSGLNHIDALLNDGPAWNYLTGNPYNTIYYSFSTAGYALPQNDDIAGGVREFSAGQQDMTRLAMRYISAVTGIDFVESDGASAQVHFVNGDLIKPRVTGECLWMHSYETKFGAITAYEAEAVIYLDNVEFGAENANLAPGGYGYETLLHELGHMLGLKHPFDGLPVLPASQDNTAYTLMSYNSAGGPYYLYGDYDVAALNWLYGKDGLGGSYGVDSVDGGIWLTGTNGNDVLTGTAGGDVLEGMAGTDVISGGDGLDYAVFGGTHHDHVITASSGAYYVGTGNLALDTKLTGVERVLFDDAMVALDIEGSGGQAYRLYQAAFNRTPDKDGLGFWVASLDSGSDLVDVAGQFIASKEFADRYGSNHPTGEAFVNLLYQNVLHRAPDQEGFNFWANALASGVSQASILVGFSESAENKAALIGTIGNGFEYTPYDPYA
jgi:hypothetical protein